ncbi:MAG: efflux RND transporter periplasmic adaptor subunit [Deltaproteobacteria bacterium]|nr:MAG: efflux RND transporter periplasmic adaptor subunit [Deltaproteobacteria bacterium]
MPEHPHRFPTTAPARAASPPAAPRLRTALLGALLGAGFVLGACDDGDATEPPDGPSAEEAPREARATPVDIIVAERGRFPDRVELVGELEAGRTTQIMVEVPGRITHLDVEEGDRVQRGQDLVRVDTSQQRAALGPLEVQLRALETEIARTERLIERGLGTEASLDQLVAQRDATREQIAQVNVTVRQSRTRATFDGIVVEKMAEAGEFANPGVPLLRVVDHSRMKVRVGLPENDIRFVREGQQVRVRIGALERSLDGEITRIGVELDARNRTFPVEIALDNEDGSLRSGMRAVVTITRRTLDDALVIPRDAVVQGFDDVELMILDDDIARQRPVTLGAGLGPFVVVEDGLESGERLIVRGHRRLVDGERVRVIDETSCCVDRFDAWENDRDTARASDAPRSAPSRSASGDPR